MPRPRLYPDKNAKERARYQRRRAQIKARTLAYYHEVVKPDPARMAAKREESRLYHREVVRVLAQAKERRPVLTHKHLGCFFGHEGADPKRPRCKSQALPGSDYCALHLLDAKACLVRYCAKPVRGVLCAAHRQAYLEAGAGEVKAWLASLTVERVIP